MEYIENKLTYEDYVALRTSVNWFNLDEEHTKKSINNSIYTIKAVDDNEAVGMGRMIGDGIYFLIVDVVVKPEYQGRGIGSQIIRMLLKYVEINTPSGGRSSVQLLSANGKEDFYVKNGFKILPHEFCGSGMRKIIKK